MTIVYTCPQCGASVTANANEVPPGRFLRCGAFNKGGCGATMLGVAYEKAPKDATASLEWQDGKLKKLRKKATDPPRKRRKR